MKKVTVCIDKDRYEIEIDDSIFDDYKLEGCTQIMERLITNGDYRIPAFMFCEEADNTKIKIQIKCGTYNSYKIMINAGYYVMAEKLRMAFFKTDRLDLADEPIQNKTQ